MSLFRFLTPPDINAGVRSFLQTPGALLLDVRTEAEYRGGHIPASRNLPLGAPKQAVEAAVPQKDTPLFVYCQSGGRSRQAAAQLKQMGYTHVTDIGGIAAYTGERER